MKSILAQNRARTPGSFCRFELSIWINGFFIGKRMISPKMRVLKVAISARQEQDLQSHEMQRLPMFSHPEAQETTGPVM